METVRDAVLLESRAHGKWMLFHFAKQNRHAWVGVHLGMTGKLRCESAEYRPGRHDQFVLRQESRTLIFTDPRQFGRVTFHQGAAPPDWWTQFPPGIASRAFTPQRVEEFLRRRARAPIKAVLLMQETFPGIGNWMADEILWRARIHPARKAGEVASQAAPLWKELRWVALAALRIVGKTFSDPPQSWLFPHRWQRGGKCPRDGAMLRQATVGGRTTVWCPKCQAAK